MVPVTVHQIGDKPARCFWQIRGILLNAAMKGDGFQQDYFLSIGRKLESLYITLGLRQLATVTPIEFH